MSARPIIATALSAVLALGGAIAGDALATAAGAQGLDRVLVLTGAGLVLAVVGVVLGARVARAPDPSPPPEPAPAADPAPEDAPTVDLQPLAQELERLAAGRATEVQLTLTDDLPESFVLAMERLCERLSAEAEAATERDARVRALADKVVALEEAVRAAERARDAFLARMSHELRTPLNAILGYVEMIHEEVDDPELRGDLDRVRGSAQSLLAIVSSILDLAQLESQAFEVIPETIDLVALVGQVQGSVRAEAEVKGNTLEVDVPEGLQVRLDRRMLSSIVLHLVSNACKYTTQGQVRVVLREASSGICLVVSDTGIGMTDRQIEEAFRPFGQGDESTTRRYDGAGLGLAVVRGFVEAMGGSVAIESELGKGARVEVGLPRQCPPRTAPLSDEEPTMLVR